MILQALKEYYDRKAAAGEIAMPGWELKQLPFLFVIDSAGKLVNIEDTRETVGKKKIAKSFLLPHSVKRSVNIAANLLWDNIEYAFGAGSGKKGDNSKRIAQCHADFVKRLENLSGVPAVDAVRMFVVGANVVSECARFPVWTEIVETDPFVSFKLVGEPEPVFRDPLVLTRIAERARVDSDDSFICLVSGNRDMLAKTHPAIKGVAGANTTGGNIVSFNFDAANSNGKKQGANAPVGEFAAFAYTTALNTLLSKDSRQRMMIGDATTVFWADKDNVLEDEFADFFAEPPRDDPDRLTVNVKALFDSLKTGAFVPEADTTRFFVLGLAPNSARISVRFWWVGTVAELAERLRIYFEDLAIVHGSKDKDHLSLFRLLVSTAQQGKAENINPRLSGELTRAVLEGATFPETLLRATLIRIKAEQGDVSYPRAKIIKAFINRKIRKTKSTEKEITIMLDKENPNIGYRLGRLFATLEKIQEAANPGINATIREKYYASASSTPAAVFGTLMRLAGNHLSKLGKEKPGWKVSLEKLIGEITYKDENSVGVAKFPTHLKLDDQGQFAIGYYHQRQDFFTKKTASESTTDK